MFAIRRSRRVVLLLAAMAIGTVSPASAQQSDASPCGSNAGGFSTWMSVRLCELLQGSVPADKQVEAPAATTASTTLLEKASAPDVFSLALGLVNAGSKPGEDERATSMTVSAFALRASITGNNPMNPSIYNKYRNWRRLSFTVGRAEAEGENTPEGRVFGVKGLVINQRDVSDGANDARFAKLTAALGQEGDLFALATRAAEEFIAQSLPDLSKGMTVTAFVTNHLSMANYLKTIDSLTEAQEAELDAVLTRFLARMQTAQKEFNTVVEEIRRAPQLALTYQAIVREDDAGHEHHVGVAFDVGLGSRLSATANGTFVKTDHPLLTDTTVAKIAGEMQFDLQQVTNVGDLIRRRGGDPMTVSVAGLGEWYSDDQPTIAKVQVKFTLPLPGIIAGLKVPFSVTFANRTELIDEKEVRGQVGFTVDLSKIQKSLGALTGR